MHHARKHATETFEVPDGAFVTGPGEWVVIPSTMWPPANNTAPIYLTRIDEQWGAKYHVSAIDGRLVISGLEIMPLAAIPSEGLTRRTVNRLRFGGARHYCRMFSPREPREQQPLPGKRVRGRPVTLTSYYKKVARRYHSMLAQGVSHIPKELAKEFGRNASTMRAIIRRARQAGFFESVSRSARNSAHR